MHTTSLVSRPLPVFQWCNIEKVGVAWGQKTKYMYWWFVTTILSFIWAHFIINYTGGALFGIFGKYTNRFGKDPIVLLGLLVHFATFLLVFYNFPVLAVFENVSPGLSRGNLFSPSKYVFLCMRKGVCVGGGGGEAKPTVFWVIMLKKILQANLCHVGVFSLHTEPFA